MHVVMGDLVEMISGAEKGKRGKVLKVDHKHGRVKVEGMRVVTRHVKPANNKPGGTEKKEAWFPANKVLPVDPVSNKPSRVAYRLVDGKKVRVAVKSGAPLVVERS